jgi:hypothetical protein
MATATAMGMHGKGKSNGYCYGYGGYGGYGYGYVLGQPTLSTLSSLARLRKKRMDVCVLIIEKL